MTQRLLLLASICLALGCKSGKDVPANGTPPSTSQAREEAVIATAPEAAIDTSVQATVPDANRTPGDSTTQAVYRMVVSFYSIGSGTENDLMTRFEDWIGTFAGQKGKNIDYEKAAWGREGETDYCFMLSELTQAEQGEFIAAGRDLLKQGKWVHVYENQECKHKRKR